METPFAKAKRQAMNAEFDSEALTKRITKLLKDRNESLREAALESGLDHQALRRFMAGQRPNMIACILLADHFDVNPNEFLQLAGWPALKVLDIPSTSARPSHRGVDVAKDIARISDPVTGNGSEAVRAL
jgi:transcriptional regulator with XRE-family HTH domain